MNKHSVKLMNDVIEKVRKIEPGKRLEDGSIKVAVSDDDIKHILDIKVLRNNVKPSIVEDLNTAGLEVKIGVVNELEISIPKDKIETNVIKYSELN